MSKTHVKTLSSKEKARGGIGKGPLTLYPAGSILDGSVNEALQDQIRGTYFCEKETQKKGERANGHAQKIYTHRKSSPDAVDSVEKNDGAAPTTVPTAATSETVVTVETTILSSNFSGL
nr:CMF_HP1_G0048300.mRNA.1.CDS.1 [Saccharomyces cerevisiae]